MIKGPAYKLVTFILLFLFSFTIRLIALYQTPYANGWDGYYYIMQMYTFIENGAMRAPDYSIIYQYYIALFYLTQDYILAFKLGSSLLAAAFTITIFFIGCYIVGYQNSSEKKSSKAILTALIIASFSIFSPTLTYFTAQFPKNLLGIIFLLWFVYFINKKQVSGIILFFVLAFLTHRMSAGLAVIVLIISLLKRKYFWISGIAVIVAIIGLSFLPGILHISDIERLKQEINIYFPLYELINYFGIDRISTLWIIELILSFIIFTYSAIMLIVRKLKGVKSSNIYIQLIIILLILCLPLFKFENAGLGFRLYLGFNLISILLISSVVHHLPNKWLLFGSFIVLSISFCSYKSYNPEKLDPPYHDYFQVVNELKAKISAETKLVVAHQGLAQIIIIYSSNNATNWQPKEDKIKSTKIARIAANIPYYYYNKYLTKRQLHNVQHLYKNYYLLPEEIWQQFKDSVKHSGNSSLNERISNWYNPLDSKPQYLLKGRKKDYIQ